MRLLTKLTARKVPAFESRVPAMRNLCSNSWRRVRSSALCYRNKCAGTKRRCFDGVRAISSPRGESRHAVRLPLPSGRPVTEPSWRRYAGRSEICDWWATPMPTATSGLLSPDGRRVQQTSAHATAARFASIFRPIEASRVSQRAIPRRVCGVPLARSCASYRVAIVPPSEPAVAASILNAQSMTPPIEAYPSGRTTLTLITQQ
jgi:hypothetical protein